MCATRATSRQLTGEKSLTAKLVSAGERTDTGQYPKVAEGASVAYFVSVGKQGFGETKVRASLAVILSQAPKECRIISTGTLQRWNILAESEEEIDEKTAHAEALQEEEEWIQNCRKILLTLGAEENPENENEITVKLNGRETKFIIHRWDELLAHPQYAVHKERYQAALNNASTKEDFERTRKETIEKFLNRSSRSSASEEGKAKYRANSQIFLDEEAPMMPLLYQNLGCQYVFYPGKCLSLFHKVYQHLLPSDARASKRHKDIWREISFKKKCFTEDVQAQVTDYFCGKETIHCSGIRKEHLDTTLYLLPEECIEEIKASWKNPAKKHNSDSTASTRMRFFPTTANTQNEIMTQLEHLEKLSSNEEALASLSSSARNSIAERLVLLRNKVLATNSDSDEADAADPTVPKSSPH